VRPGMEGIINELRQSGDAIVKYVASHEGATSTLRLLASIPELLAEHHCACSAIASRVCLSPAEFSA
jgi:hypothetical protein